METHDNETFHYTYSAAQQDEVKAIRNKYAPLEEDKMAMLRRLDAGVSQKATVRALIVGILGTLVMGLGMSLFMSDLSAILGAYKSYAMIIGIVAGLLGIALISCAYPIYQRTLKKERERIAPEILRLTDELMK